MTHEGRRPLVAVIGDANLEACDERLALAHAVGALLVDEGCRVLTGGRGGVMAAAMAGARTSDRYQEGDTIAVLPSHDPADAAESADIVLATGMGLARNIIVANSDGVIAIGGGAGTLSEIALAWQLRRPIVALTSEGWSGRLQGCRIDDRMRQGAMATDVVFAAGTPAEAVDLIIRLIPRYPRGHGLV